MAYFQPISFSPGNPLGEAIQQTAAQIGQMKAIQREEMKALVDVSLEGVMSNFQDEVSRDLNKFKTDAARVYAEQGRFGKPLDMKEYAKLQTKKKEILAKVSHAKLLTDYWETTIAEAAKLKSDPVRGNILDESTEPAMEAWKNGKESIWDKPDPRTLVRRRYGMQEMTADYDAITKQTKESALKSPQSVIRNGREERRIIYDPMQQADAIWEGAPQIQNFWVKEAKGDTRLGREMYDQWLKNQSVDALDLQGGGTHVYNYIPGFGVGNDKFNIFPYKNREGNIAYDFSSQPMDLKAGQFIGKVGQIYRNPDGTWDKVISQVSLENPDGSFSAATPEQLSDYIAKYEKESGQKVSRTERDELVMKLTPSDVNQLAWLPIAFQKSEEHGLSFKNPEEPIKNYSPYKSQREIQEEARRIVSKKKIGPQKTEEQIKEEAKGIVEGRKTTPKPATKKSIKEDPFQ